MIGSDRLGFSFVRVTAIHASEKRLWIGSGNGIVISVPLESENNSDNFNDEDVIKPGIENAQLALHGFKDAVRFFCENEGLVIAGGVGSIDFRSEGIGQTGPAGTTGEKSHLLAWHET